MNGRQAKAIRRLYRKDIRSQIADQIDAMGDLIRPKPKYVPAFVWNALRRLILKI